MPLSEQSLATWAQQLYENKLFREILNNLVQRYQAEWIEEETPQGREVLHTRVVAVKDIWGTITDEVDNIRLKEEEAKNEH